MTEGIVAMLPLLVVSLAALAVTMAIALWRNHLLVFLLTIGGLALSLAALPAANFLVPRHASPLLIVDHYAYFYLALVIAATLIVAMLSYGYLKAHRDRPEEYYLLLLLATLGSGILICSSHLVSFFLGLELLSVSLYALIAYRSDDWLSAEAGLKYLVLAGVSSAFLLFGMALVYANIGSMTLRDIVARTTAADPLMLAAMVLVSVGIGFKLALAPFHFWTPDVYQGAPAPVTAYVATVSKGAMFALMLRYLRVASVGGQTAMFTVFAVMSVASMFTGNLLALKQNSVKRILAYSSIAHLGYLLVAFLAAGALAVNAITFYLVAYFITTLGAFGVVTVLSRGPREADELGDYQGLAWRRPWLAATMTAMLLSLAGLPVTAGFMGKFYVIAAGATAGLWALVIILIVNSAIGLYYYLRIVATMFKPVPEEARAGQVVAAPAFHLAPLLGGLALCVLMLALVWLGVYPEPMLRVIKAMVAGIS